MVLHCDNKAPEPSAVVGCSNKLRHVVEIRYYYVRECVSKELVKISWICSKDQIADIFTKPLSLKLHNKLAEEILNFKLE
ncbi:hypothetical protein TKK_0018614 [Trichogramma kaykai]